MGFVGFADDAAGLRAEALIGVVVGDGLLTVETEPGKGGGERVVTVGAFRGHDYGFLLLVCPHRVQVYWVMMRRVVWGALQA